MKRKYLTCILTLAVLFTIQWCSSTIPSFNTEEYQKNKSKMTRKYIEPTNTKNLKKANIQSVAIVEFNVEYLVNFGTPEDYQKATDRMYDIFVQTVEDQLGWQVVEKNDIANSHVYRSLSKKDYIKGGGYTHKGGGTETTTSIVPVSGLGILGMEKAKGLKALAGAFQQLGNQNKEPGILDEVGADAAMKVHIIAFNEERKDDIRAKLPGAVKGLASVTKVDLMVGFNKNPGSIGSYVDPNGNKWMYSYVDTYSFKLKNQKKDKDQLISAVNCQKAGGDRWEIDTDKYIEGYGDLFTVFSEMVAIQIKQ